MQNQLLSEAKGEDIIHSLAETYQKEFDASIFTLSSPCLLATIRSFTRKIKAQEVEVNKHEMGKINAETK